MSRLGIAALAMIVMLAVFVGARSAADQLLGANHPRRALVGQVILYGCTALLVVILLLLRQ